MKKHHSPIKKEHHEIIKKEEKKEVLFRGVGINLVVYILIGLLLLILGIPSLIVLFTEAVLIWGLLVLGYAFYYHKS